MDGIANLFFLVMMRVITLAAAQNHRPGKPRRARRASVSGQSQTGGASRTLPASVIDATMTVTLEVFEGRSHNGGPMVEMIRN